MELFTPPAPGTYKDEGPKFIPPTKADLLKKFGARKLSTIQWTNPLPTPGDSGPGQGGNSAADIKARAKKAKQHATAHVETEEHLLDDMEKMIIGELAFPKSDGVGGKLAEPKKDEEKYALDYLIPNRKK